MNVARFTLNINVGRSINYQTCAASVSVEVDLEPGETVTQGIDRYKGAILGHIRKVTKDEVLQLSAERRELERQ